MEPFGKPRLMVSRTDDDRILVKNYGVCESLEIRDFLYAGNPDDDFWAVGIIEQVHKTCVPIYLHKGFNEVQIELLSKIPAVEKIIFYREGTIPRISCMGPAESWKR